MKRMLSNRSKLVIGGVAVLSLVLFFSSGYQFSSTEKNQIQGPEVFSVTPTVSTLEAQQVQVDHESTQINSVTRHVDLDKEGSSFPGLMQAMGIPSGTTNVSLTEWSMPGVIGRFAIDPSGNFWFNDANKIARFNPSTGNMTEWTTPSAAATCAFAYDSITNSVYFTEYALNRIGKIDPATNGFTEWFLVNQNGVDQACAIQADQTSGTLYFINDVTDGNQLKWLNKLVPSTNTQTSWSITPNNSGGANMEEMSFVLKSGIPTIYFIESNEPSTACSGTNSCIDQFLPNSNSLTRWAVPQPGACCGTTKYDPVSGNTYFGEGGGNRIGRLNQGANTITQWIVPTASSNPHYVTVDSAGTVYFTEFSVNKIGRLVPSSNLITEWTLPTAGSQAQCPLVDSSDNLLFTENGGARFGKVS